VGLINKVFIVSALGPASYILFRLLTTLENLEISEFVNPGNFRENLKNLNFTQRK